MASYIIPPRQRNSDYTKGMITQDEYLRIAAANDANISAARKALKRGEVVQLTPIQDATPDELLADIGKQESDARSNLMRLGFRDQEAARITADLMNEPDILRMLNVSFPAIDADIKKRFNPRLITPTFFLQYLREYNENLNASRGLDVNSSAAVRRPINALINNIGELRAIIPDPTIIEYLRTMAQNQRLVGQETLDRLATLRDIVLDPAGLAVVGALPPVNQYQLIQQITDVLRDVPTRAEVDNLARIFRDELQSGSNVERREIIKRLNDLAAAVPNRADIQGLAASYREAGITRVTPPRRREEVLEEISLEEEEEEESPTQRSARLKQERNRKAAETALATGGDPRRLTADQQAIYAQLAGITRVAPTISDLSDFTGTTTESLGSSVGIPTATLTQIKSTFKANPELIDRLVATANVGMYSVGQRVNYNDLAKSAPQNTPKQRKIFIDDTNIADLFRTKFGRGIKKGVSDIKKGVLFSGLKKIKLGKGIAVQEQPTYKEFGKYAIHIPQLEEQDILNVKYKSLGGIPKFKPFPVSDIFRDFMLDVLDGKRPSERVYIQIEPKERKAFEEISIGAGVWSSFGLKRTTTNDDEEERKRFEVLKGIYNAGNNSPQVSQELRRLITKFINEGKMKRQQGLNLLMELSI